MAYVIYFYGRGLLSILICASGNGIGIDSCFGLGIILSTSRSLCPVCLFVGGVVGDCFGSMFAPCIKILCYLLIKLSR